MTGRLFFGNFDFEHQLTGVSLPASASRLERINLELTPALASLAKNDDVIFSTAEYDGSFESKLETAGLSAPHFVDSRPRDPSQWNLIPWGWSEPVVRWAERRGFRLHHPPLPIVRQINSRMYALQCEQAWNCGLEGAQAVDNLEQLSAVLKQAAQQYPRWAIKSLFGMSGRERQLGKSAELTPQIAAWARKRIERDGAVVFEPWVDRIDEAGLQWKIPEHGKPRLLGITPLLSDPTGQFRGNRLQALESDAILWQPAVDAGRRIALDCQAQGYFGPLGIDAMRYRDANGAERTRPLQDINARFTMGRIALGYRRCLSDKDYAIWLNLSRPIDCGSIEEFFACKQKRIPAGCRLIPTSPRLINGTPPQLCHCLLIASSERDLGVAERELLK